jgi:hypothetical protein
MARAFGAKSASASAIACRGPDSGSSRRRWRLSGWIEPEDEMKKWGHVFCGLLAGIAFVVACENGGVMGGPDGGVRAGSEAHAAPDDCATWQVLVIETDQEKLLAAGTVPTLDGTGYAGVIWEPPAGWEPFGATRLSGENLYFRRCKP